MVALVLINILVHQFVVRWDMTNDRRYSIAPATRTLIHDLDAPLQITILLDGELNAGFQRLQRATIEMVEELEAIGDRISDIGYRVSAEDIPQGISPTVIHERTHKGQTAQTTVYPYALMTYKGKTAVVELLRNNRADVYDALMSKRVYKSAWSEDDVLKYLREQGGTQFDPELIEVFISVYDIIKAIRNRYSE